MKLPRETKERLAELWRQQKILNLDFRGLDRFKIAEEIAARTGDIKAAMPVFMGGFIDDKRYRTAGYAVAIGQEDYPTHFYSLAEMFDVVEQLVNEYWGKDIEVHIGYEVFEKFEGRFDLSGKERLEGTYARLRYGEIVESH